MFSDITEADEQRWRERCFALIAEGRLWEGFAHEPAHQIFCAGEWMSEELVSMGASDATVAAYRRAQNILSSAHQLDDEVINKCWRVAEWLFHHFMDSYVDPKTPRLTGIIVKEFNFEFNRDAEDRQPSLVDDGGEA